MPAKLAPPVVGLENTNVLRVPEPDLTVTHSFAAIVCAPSPFTFTVLVVR